MHITYLGHSGFLAEWEDIACIFDWAEGTLPPIDPAKKLFVFVSHVHSDHCNAGRLEKCAYFPQHTFILSDDIGNVLPAKERVNITEMGPHARRTFRAGRGTLSVNTLASTDCGVAFVVNYAGRTIYHAGDLHWWAWPDDTPEEERAMQSDFYAELSRIKGIRLDAAFLPLDPRLEDNFWKGFDAVMRACSVRAAFPMHMWGRYDTPDRLRAMAVAADYREQIMDIRAEGQTFDIP